MRTSSSPARKALHANCGSQGLVAASSSSVICSTWSKSMRPASGSRSIASTTLSRSPRDRGLDRRFLAGDDAAQPLREHRRRRRRVAARERRRRRCVTIASTTGPIGQVGTLAGVRQVEREVTRLVAQERVDHRRDHLARRQVGNVRRGLQLRELALVVVLPGFAVGDRREPDAPPLAPLRLLGEEAGEELDEVAVARAGQHAEAFEQRELHPVGGEHVALAEAAAEAVLLVAEARRQVHRLVAACARCRRGARAGGRTRRRRAILHVGDDRQVVHAGDREVEVAEVGVEELRQRELRHRDLVAQADGLDARSRASPRGTAWSSGW